MDQPHSDIAPGLTLPSDNIPGAFPAHLGNPASPSRQLLSRLTVPGMLTELLRELDKQNPCAGGFFYPTCGLAAMYLLCLRDPDTRKDFLLSLRVSPADFCSDEHLARMLAVTQMLLNAVKMRDAEVNKRFDQFCQERRKAQRVHGLELGPDYEEVAFRHVYTALAHLYAAVEPRDCDARKSVGDIVRYIGWCLERDFSIRAAKLVTNLVNDAFGLRRKMKERQVRYLCGWERRSPMKNRTRGNRAAGSV